MWLEAKMWGLLYKLSPSLTKRLSAGWYTIYWLDGFQQAKANMKGVSKK
ncbi:hypothetical protein [Bacillus phage vB_BceS-M2]|nr:hypothetical protein PBC5_041 [Bacillus phage PBC5]